MTKSIATSFAQWLDKIEKMHPADIEMGLDRIKVVAAHLGILEPDCKVITVGGTNGKGSTVAMLESLCIQANKRVGVYTSPHLIRFNERIKVDGNEADDHELVACFEMIEKQQQTIQLTFFEYTTLAALIYFQQKGCEIIVLEVGLGGRQDATNIIDSDVAVVTTIDLDHVDWLGNTLEQIAFEKGGIARQGKPCLVGDTKSLELLKRAYPKIENQFVYSGDHRFANLLAENNSLNRHKLLTQNLSLAISAFESIFQFELNQKQCEEALDRICLNGRFQILAQSPYIVLDVAHNPQSAVNLAEQISDFCSQHKVTQVTAICGMMRDKNIKQVLITLFPHINNWCFVDLPIERAITAEELKLIAEEIVRESVDAHNDYPISTYASPQLALQACQLNSHYEQQLILVFGSFITVGNVIQ